MEMAWQSWKSTGISAALVAVWLASTSALQAAAPVWIERMVASIVHVPGGQVLNVEFAGVAPAASAGPLRIEFRRAPCYGTSGGNARRPDGPRLARTPLQNGSGSRGGRAPLYLGQRAPQVIRTAKKFNIQDLTPDIFRHRP